MITLEKWLIIAPRMRPLVLFFKIEESSVFQEESHLVSVCLYVTRDDGG